MIIGDAPKAVLFRADGRRRMPHPTFYLQKREYPLAGVTRVLPCFGILSDGLAASGAPSNGLEGEGMKEEKGGFSRRSFLRGVGALGAAGVFGALNGTGVANAV